MNNKNTPAGGSNSDVMSVTNNTVTSIDTLKASNRTQQQQKQQKQKQQSKKSSISKQKSSSTSAASSSAPAKKGWKQLKKKLTTMMTDAPAAPTRLNNRSRSDGTTKTDRSLEDRAGSSDLSDMRRMDDAIRGRRDGMDSMSLGPARLLLSCGGGTMSDMERFIQDMNEPLTCRTLVMDTMASTRGRDIPELVLEGFLPGGEDRWMVRQEPDHSIIAMGGPTTTTTTTAASPALSPRVEKDACGPSCGAVFMESLWGTNNPPPPTHTKIVEEEDVLKMASECNIPIDIDEDTFIIETANHLLAIHDIAAISLRRGNYDTTITIFEKILKGLRIRHESNPHYLIGTTLHNIGVIRMCQGNVPEALKAFQDAVAMRTKSLPTNHPDVAVSLVRQAMAQFALDQYPAALTSLSAALDMVPKENGTRAKILNNLGVAQYHAGELRKALRSFAGALEIQRQRLEGPIRRENTILDATTTLGNMGKLYLEKGDFDTAFFVFEEALLVCVILYYVVVVVCLKCPFVFVGTQYPSLTLSFYSYNKPPFEKMTPWF